MILKELWWCLVDLELCCDCESVDKQWWGWIVTVWADKEERKEGIVRLLFLIYIFLCKDHM